MDTVKRKRRLWKVVYNVFLYGFALTGIVIVCAWSVYSFGLTKNRGAIDRNNRYLFEVSDVENFKKDTTTSEDVVETCAKLAALGTYYPKNASLILNALQNKTNPVVVRQMMDASLMYMDSNLGEYEAKLENVLKDLRSGNVLCDDNIIPWMNTFEWGCLKESILKDKSAIIKAAGITGVEPRLIVGCLIGEQIRLFNSKREMFKKYLGPVKVLSVQSQFSLGVTGVKNFTAIMVENHLKDSTSEFYMGKDFEHILDFKTENHDTERVYRLVNYRNHLYSYIYAGCILHQTMLQWKRAGYDISTRPDILFTLFNVGFSRSEPKPDPKCGGSKIRMGGKIYTFGAIGFDFYYSGELVEDFPYNEEHFSESIINEHYNI